MASTPTPFALARRAVVLGLAATALAACGGDIRTRGYLADDRTIAELKPGLPAPRVLQILGTPSTTSTVGNGSWYYISQQTQQRLQFLEPTIVDQRVLAVYFDKSLKLERVANYGLQDGKVFDFISRTTPAGGTEQSFIRQVFRGIGTFNPLGV